MVDLFCADSCSSSDDDPVLWMLLTSFKTFEDSTKIPLQILPEQWILTNYTEILEVFPIAKWFMNSILAVVISLLAQVFLWARSLRTAFARLRFPGKKFLFLLMLSIMMIPEQIFIIPRYNTLAAVGLTNTRVGFMDCEAFFRICSIYDETVYSFRAERTG